MLDKKCHVQMFPKHGWVWVICYVSGILH